MILRKVLPLALLAVALTTASGVWYRVHQTRAFFDQHALLSRFPAEEAAVVSVDVSLLRQAGLLGSSSALPPEAEYKQFLEGTGFDYKRDLDTLVASFSDKGNFFIARGRFNWSRLREYAARQGGSCYQELCRLQGSTPDRHISFMPLRNDALALAVSTNDLAVTQLTRPGQPITATLPAEPVWLSLPGSELRKPNALPGGLRYVLSALQTADRILFTVGLGNPASAGIEARLETTCRTADDAKVLASQLRIATSTLKQALAHDPQAQADELAALLTAGNFDQTDRKVFGKWPVKSNLLALLTQGL